MKAFWSLFAVLLLTVGCTVFQPSAGNFTVNPLFCDNMVMQREMRNTVWGTARTRP